MRWNRTLLVSCLVAGTAACATTGTPEWHPKVNDHTRLVASAKAAHEYSGEEQAVVVPFGQRENGTRLVLALMDNAQARGAVFVSDLEFLQVFRWGDTLVECATPLALADHAPAPAPAAAAPTETPAADDIPSYETSLSAPVPKKVDVRMAEDVLVCKKVAHSHAVVVPVAPSRFDVEIPHSTTEMPMRKEIQVNWTEECHAEHVIHDVERYDFQVKLEWQPPDWKMISQQWSDDPLVEGTPRCYRTTLAKIGDPPRHRMRARFYYRSHYRDTLLEPEPPTKRY
jgi:hypothetical protein